jgi:ubiquinone/menaquinone biosynthesis C-methylase UbiE
MRRMAIPALKRGLVGKPRGKLLDVGTGTGRFLLQVHETMPDLQLYALDMSPYYLKHARRVLRSIPNVNFVAENAERIPFPDNHFDAVSSVFLFHELPKDARRNVMSELYRVVKPGSQVVINDSAQLVDSPYMECFLDNFHRMYHEPYYKGYMKDNLESMVQEIGFELVESSPHFLSKVVVARKP